MALLAYFAGALLGTFLISRLLLWIFKRLGDNAKRLLVAYGVAWAVTMLLNWGGSRSDISFDPVEVFVPHTVAYLIWFGVDWLRFRRRRAKAASDATEWARPIQPS